MTIRIEPTNGSAVTRAVSSRRLAATSRYGGSDWIVPSTRDINASRDGALASGPLNGFVRNDGNDTNQTVNFDTGEAFVGGAYIASDDDTVGEHSVGPLPDNTTSTIYIGWDLSTADTLIIGTSGDFGTHDPKAELWEVTTDGSGITDDTDLRSTAPGSETGDVVADSGFDNDDTTTLTLDTGTIANPYPQYEILIARECDATSRDYQNLRINGITSGDYYYDFFDAVANGFDSVDAGTSFGKIAGTGLNTGTNNSGAAVAQQRMVVGLPQDIGFDTTGTDPVISTDVKGVGKNIDHIHSGNLDIGATEIDRIEVFGGSASTGRILIRGVDPFR